ncbi:MAG TPA: multidrug effflux MFS transporter [Steroidobacteraceae bacterium]|nr:multidrug effflux MFS transporter [Steroidobacteraceae bacterium]
MRLKIANARGAPTIGITLLLASLSMISPLSIDTFLPSLPTIATHFGLTRFEVQQIITAYLLPFAFFSLVHGPLSDALGRRRVVLGGLALFTLGSLGCIWAPTFGTLLMCRVLQGTAAGLGPTVSRAVVRDMFEGPGAQKLMSSIMLVFSLAPAVAPVIGGWVQVTLGWRWVFGMLFVLGAALLVTCALLLPETHPPEKRTEFHPVALIKSCSHIAAQPSFLLLAISAALAMSSLFIYIGSAPAIILERWHLKETQFHYIFIPVVAGFMVASLVGGRIAGRVSRVAQMRFGFALLCLAGITGTVAHLWSRAVPILLIQVLLFGMASGAQLTYPVLTLEMIDMHPQARGAAASVQTFIALGLGGIAMGLIAPTLHGDLKLLAFISLATATLAWLGWRAGAALSR